MSFRNGEKRRSVYYVSARSCGGSRSSFATSRKRGTTLKEAAKWSTGTSLKKVSCKSTRFPFYQVSLWIETYCVFDGLDEEMTPIGTATRRSSRSLTSECIKAATTVGSSGFPVSTPERGAAFQQPRRSSTTRMTGKEFG